MKLDEQTARNYVTWLRRHVRAIAAAHETWIEELLCGVSVDETRQLATMLKSFRSNWEGRE